MENAFLLLITFICGILFNVFWGYLLGLGYGSMAFKQSVRDSLILLAKNVQSANEIHHLKYLSYEMLNRDQKYIDFQRQVDINEMKSLKNTLIRNYINTIPPKYNDIVKFYDWESAMEYLNKELQREK